MRFQSAAGGNSPMIQRHLAGGCKFLVLVAVLCGLVGATTLTTRSLCAQDPMPPAPPEEEEVEDPRFVDFSAIPYPGADNWLISGQIVGCNDPSDIEVEIGGVVTTTATTDVLGYFEAIVSYSGNPDNETADATYRGVPLDQAICSIGF